MSTPFKVYKESHFTFIYKDVHLSAPLNPYGTVVFDSLPPDEEADLLSLRLRLLSILGMLVRVEYLAARVHEGGLERFMAILTGEYERELEVPPLHPPK